MRANICTLSELLRPFLYSIIIYVFCCFVIFFIRDVQLCSFIHKEIHEAFMIVLPIKCYGFVQMNVFWRIYLESRWDTRNKSFKKTCFRDKRFRLLEIVILFITTIFSFFLWYECATCDIHLVSHGCRGKLFVPTSIYFFAHKKCI